MPVKFTPCTCTCDDPIRDPRTVRLAYASRVDAERVLTEGAPFHCGADGMHDDGACCHFHAGRRYHVCCGPAGHAVLSAGGAAG